MKRHSLFITLAVVILLNSGCATKLASFEKRKYTKGYHVGFAKKIDKKIKNNTEIALNVPVKKSDIQNTETVFSETGVGKIVPTQPVLFKENNKLNNIKFKALRKVEIKRVLKKNFQKIAPHKNTAEYRDPTTLIAWGIIWASLALTILLVTYLLGTLSILTIILASIFFIGGAIMIVIGAINY